MSFDPEQKLEALRDALEREGIMATFSENHMVVRAGEYRIGSLRGATHLADSGSFLIYHGETYVGLRHDVASVITTLLRDGAQQLAETLE